MADAHVRDACAAALASDAGTPEGEREPPGVAEVEAFHRRVRELGSIEAVRELEAPAPDAELDRLLEDYVAIIAEYRAAIHAHVARVTQGARAGRMRDMDVPTLHKRPKPESAPAPAPGDASGETDPFRYSENRRIDSNPLTMQCSKLCQLIEEFPASPQQTACIEEANRLLNGLLNQHLETQQLRAAAGEVVGTGYIATSTDGGIDFYAQSWAFTGDKLDPIRGLNVLVVRRDKGAEGAGV